MMIKTATNLDRQASFRMQFKLRTAFLAVTICALTTWVTVEVGFIPIVGASIAILIGGFAGLAVGLPFGYKLRCMSVGAVSALTAVSVAIIWLLSILAWDLRSRGQHFPVVIPLELVLRDWLHVTAAVIALAAAVPLAAIATVYDRPGVVVVLRSTYICAIAAVLVGLACIGFDVWTRGGMNGPLPLPYPIAVMFPLFAVTVAGGALGFVSGLTWLVVRSIQKRMCCWPMRSAATAEAAPKPPTSS
jgi:hypothetical protein